MLSFHRQCFEEVESSKTGALVVTGKGLGDWRIILQTLRQACSSSSNAAAADASPRRLILVINNAHKFSGEDNASLIDMCAWWARIAPNNLPQTIDAQTSSQKRRQLYSTGGCFFITSRILVADLLNKCFAGANLAGLIVLRAHLVTEHSNEAFVIRMVQQTSPNAFIKCFSDSPQSLAAKTLAAVLKSLRIQRVLLYPRFRAQVRQVLDREDGVELIQVAQPMSECMREIQAALVEAMRGCVEEIKRTNGAASGGESALLSEITLEGALFRATDLTLRQRLEATTSWHTSVSNKTKQLLEDVKTLRLLIKDLLRMDCVSFMERLLEVKQRSLSEEQSVKSMWLFTNAAERAFSFAKARLFTISADRLQLTLVLEPNLKLDALKDVLAEEEQAAASGGGKDCTRFGGSAIIVLVRDATTLSQVTSHLSSPSLLQRKWLHFLTKNVAAMGNDLCLHQEIVRLEKWREQLAADSSEAPRRFQASFTDDKFHPQNCYNRGDAVRILQPRERVISVHLLSEAKELGLLDLLQPNTVIVFDPDVGIMREIECYDATLDRPLLQRRTKCYWLYFESSLEEQTNDSYLNQERDAFLKLVEQKSELVFASEEPAEAGEMAHKKLRETALTTTGGGEETAAGGRGNIIVDVREFNAALPNVLQLHGFDLDARTLQVGDYILSPDICVERKSIPDLVGSFNDGRLFAQCGMMSRHYKRPVLLIEFPESGPFRLGSAMLSSRLVLLCLHFPELRLVWSKTLRCTVNLFREMQRNQPKPNGDLAEQVEASGPAANDEVENYEAFELLKQLPGVTKSNSFRIARRANSLAQLCKLTLPELVDCCEGETNAKLLHTFLHKQGLF